MELDSVPKYHLLEPTWPRTQLAEHWASNPKVVGSIPTVAGHIFQARPVWIYTQSNITNIIFTWVPNTNTEKIIKYYSSWLHVSIKRPLNHTKIQRVQSPWPYNINSDKNIRLLLRPRSRAPLTLLQRRDPCMMWHVSDDSRRSVGVLPLYYSVKMSGNMSRLE